MREKISYQNAVLRMQIAFATVLFFVSAIHAQSDSYFYKDSLFSCKYQTKSGMLNGLYQSFYKNGVKKSEGTFEYNHRAGIWSVWDSTGKLRVQRNYSNPYEYKQIVPATPQEGPIPLLSKPVYTLQRDSLGEWKNYILQERMCVYRQRNFKCFYTSEKGLFFDCKQLFDVLYSNALKKNYSLYIGKKGVEDNSFDSRLDLSTADSALIDTSKFKLVGFRVKSDWIFDDTRFVSDERPLCITPLVINKINMKDKTDNFISKDTMDLFNVYIPDVRKYLVKVKISSQGLPSYIQNLDDVFFFCCYSFKRFRTANTYSYTDLSNTNKSVSNPDVCIIREIETENNLWLHFNK